MQISKTSVLSPLRLALRPARPSSRARCLVGASLGIVFFLFVGLLPSVLVGGSAGIQLANLAGGAPHAHAFGVRALAVLGVVATTAMGAAIFAALGAAMGAAVGQLSSDRAARTPAP